MKKKYLAVLAGGVFIFVSGITNQTALAKDAQSNGQPFQELREAIENIELTPGPQGPQGETGPMGPQGPTGPAGADAEIQELQEIIDSICAIVDQVPIEQHPSFCPVPVECPCWPGVTVDEIATAFNNAIITDPICVDYPSLSYAGVGDNDDADPLMASLSSGGIHGCKVRGLLALTPDVWDYNQPDGWKLDLTYEEVQGCYADMKLVIQKSTVCH